MTASLNTDPPQAEEIEEAIRRVRDEIRDLDSKSEKISPRSLALKLLGRGPAKSPPLLSEITRVAQQRTEHVAKLDGLIELRLEVEPDRLRAEINRHRRTVEKNYAEIAPLGKRVLDLQDQLVAAQEKFNERSRVNFLPIMAVSEATQRLSCYDDSITELSNPVRYRERMDYDNEIRANLGFDRKRMPSTAFP